MAEQRFQQRANWFIGFPILETDWLPSLTQDLPSGLRAFSAADLHVTLAFLGPVSEAKARAAWRRLLQSPPPAMTVRFGPVEAFGNPRQPTAFSLTFGEGQDALKEVLTQLTNVLRVEAGLPPENRAPRPHVTLARPTARSRARRDARETTLHVEWMRAVAPPTAPVVLREVALYTWAEDRRAQLFIRRETLTLVSGVWDGG